MKQIFTTITLLAMTLSFASCEKEIIVNCNCNCQCGNSDQSGNRPGDGGQDNNGGSNNGGSNNDNNGGSGSGNTDVDRSEYETYNNTFTNGHAGFWGVYYDDQPQNTSNWYIELADNNYDLENFEGTGFNITFDLFASGSNSSSIPSGKYTIEAFNRNAYSAGSLMYGDIAEDENGEYPIGTWLYEGNDGIAGATAGWVEISGSGSSYTIKYELHDDEFQVSFKGSFSGSLTLVDETVEASNAAATKSARSAKHFRVRR